MENGFIVDSVQVGLDIAWTYFAYINQYPRSEQPNAFYM